jgi:hypothetical protein
VLYDLVDTVAINTTRYRRSCDPYAPAPFQTNCDVNLPESLYNRSDAGDFFVTAPLSDVAPDLRGLVSAGAAQTHQAAIPLRLSMDKTGRLGISNACAGSIIEVTDLHGRLIARWITSVPSAAVSMPAARICIVRVTSPGGTIRTFNATAMR